jgi:peptidoglycan/xylan/chitin deacetylase (PgdA/CDA1 family)
MKISKRIYIPLIFAAVIHVGCGTHTPSSATPSGSAAPRVLVFKNTTVSLTFDDGDADNYTARDTLASNNLHATFYIVSDLTDTEGYMSDEQLHNLYKDGNEIGGHTLNHAELTKLNDTDLKREICQNRVDLLASGFNVISFAYPFGHYNEAAKKTVEACGYNNARIVIDGPETIPPGDPFALRAMPYIVPDTRLPKMIRYISQVEQSGGGWVIFIFHHICDNCDKFSVAPQTFSDLTNWLNEQQANGLVIRTVGEVIGGETQPGVQP